MKRSRAEAIEPQRAPLFLFVIPFGLGLLANRIVLWQTTLPALALILAGLLLLLFSARLRQPLAWHLPFFLVTFSIGAMYGEQTLTKPSPRDHQPPKAPREQGINVEPIQLFAAPPYSNSQIGLGKIVGEENLLYFRAPAENQSSPFPAGFEIRIFGVPRSLEAIVPDPGFRTYLEDRGVVAGINALTPGEIVAIASPFRAVFAVLLEKSKQALAAGSSPLESSSRVYQALVLGQRIGLAPRQKEVFRDTGTAHLFAISGLHVGLVGGFLFGFFHLLRVRRPLQISATLLILLFYVLLTGATPSAVRAFLMITFLVGAKAFQRSYCPTSALAASALIVLLFDPAQLFTLGFQLSYIVVLAILVFGAPMAQRLMDLTDPEYWLPGRSGSPFHRLRRWLFASFSISLAAFLGSATLIMEHFQILPLSSIVLNLLLIFPATIVLLIGFISLISGLLSAFWLSAPLNSLARLIINAMTEVVGKTADLPIAAMPVSFSNSWAGPIGTLLFLLVTFWVASRPHFRFSYLSLPAGCVILTALLGSLV